VFVYQKEKKGRRKEGREGEKEKGKEGENEVRTLLKIKLTANDFIYI
jgi:hypothetical protein